MERADVTEPMEFLLELNRWVASYDLTFVADDSGRDEVRCGVVSPQPCTLMIAVLTTNAMTEQDRTVSTVCESALMIAVLTTNVTCIERPLF